MIWYNERHTEKTEEVKLKNRSTPWAGAQPSPLCDEVGPNSLSTKVNLEQNMHKQKNKHGFICIRRHCNA